MTLIKKVSIILALSILVGCSYDMRLIDFDSGQLLQGGFNTSTHEVWVSMSDGTILTGKYVEIRNDSINFGSVTGTAFSGTKFGSFASIGASYSLGSTSIGYAILTNSGTKLMMEVIVRANLDNTGMGEARTNDGKSYKVIF